MEKSQMICTWWCCLIALAFFASEIRAQDTSCLTQLVPCLNYLNSTGNNPSSDCCNPLKSVISSNPQCLCSMISGNTAASGQSSINVTQALLLPSKCGLNVDAATCAAESSPTTRTADTNSASGFSIANALVAAVLLLTIQVSLA